MVSQEFIELINKELDGVNTSGDTSKLKDHLKANPEAQTLYDELASTINTLSCVTPLEPPVNLKQNILDAIQMEEYAVEPKRNPFAWLVNALKGSFDDRYRLARYAYSFAAGLAIGVISYGVVVDTQGKATVDMSELYGTMILKGVPEGFTAGDEAAIEIEDGSGSIDVRYTPDLVLAQLNLNTKSEVEVVLEFDANDLSFNGFVLPDNVRNSLVSDEGSLTLANTGDNTYLILFKNKLPSVSRVDIKVFGSGHKLFETTVSSGK